MNLVGCNIQRTDARDKATGKLKYAIDIDVASSLYGALLYSTETNAVIKHIDTSDAKSSPGTEFVFTGADLPSPIPRFGSDIRDYPLLADGEVLFKGQPVAVVLADTEHNAKESASKIKVRYESRHAVCSFPSFGDGKLLIEPDDMPLYHPLEDVFYSWGDVNKARKQGYAEIKGEYEFPMVYHFPLERFGCLAKMDSWGNLVIFSPVQHPYSVRRTIADCLGLPLSKVIVEATSIGGGFGGKGYAKLEPLAGYLAIKTGRIIRLFVSIDEGFNFARRVASKIIIRTGFHKDGSILYQDIEGCSLMGAFSDAAPRIVIKSSITACGPYKVPNASIRVHRVYSNTSPATAFRGFGMPQFTLAVESQMNKIARTLNIDLVEIRKKNLPKMGEKFMPIEAPADGDWVQALDKAASLIDWGTHRHEKHGKGIAIGLKNGPGGVTSHAIARLHSDNSLTLSVGTTEMGQGSSTVLKQLASDSLGVPIEKINAVMGNTLAAPFDISTAGSRGTVQMGRTVRAACNDIVRQLKDIASKISGMDIDEINIRDGYVEIGEECITYDDLMKKYYGHGLGEIVGKGYDVLERDNSHPMGGITDYWCFCVNAVELKVDKDTGEVDVLKCVSVADAGKLINPLMSQEQMNGGTIMALGHSLTERISYDDSGFLSGGSSVNYKILTAADIPREILCGFVENFDGSGPEGAKGIGESATLAVAPAVTEAIRDAIGVELTSLPCTPEAIWNAMNITKSQTGIKYETRSHVIEIRRDDSYENCDP